MTRVLLLFALAGGILLAGCGQSGPLYLPGDPSEVRQAPRPPVDENADEEEEEADESR